MLVLTSSFLWKWPLYTSYAEEMKAKNDDALGDSHRTS